MKYTMNVTIANPKTPEGMTSDILMKLDCEFAHDPTQYGNGYFLYIGNGNFENHLDIRYDYTFNPDKKVEYLERWAHAYWSGKDGAYIVKQLNITRAE